MRKRFMPTLIALAVFIVLFAYVNLNEVNDIPAPGTDAPVDLATIPMADVKAVTWKLAKNSGKGAEEGPEIRVDVGKENNIPKYEITKPRVYRVETSELEGVLHSFEDLKSERVISQNATDTKAFGIGTDSAQVSIETATQTFTYLLGDASPVGGLVYFQKVGDPAVYLVKSSVKSSFNKGVSDLRNKNIFFEDFSGISSITLEVPSGTIQLEQRKNMEWVLVSPRELPAEGGEVSGLIYGITNLKVNKFVKDEPSASETYGFEKPLYRAVLHDAKGNKYELLSGKEENGQFYVKRGDQKPVYSVLSSSLGFLNKNVNLLRSKDLPKLSRDGMQKIILAVGTETQTIENASNTWTVNGKTVAKEKVTQLLDAYHSGKIVAFLPESEREKENLLKTDGAAKFELVGASESHAISFGKGDGNNISLLLDKNEEIYKLPMNLFNAYNALREEVKQAKGSDSSASSKPDVTKQPKDKGAATSTALPIQGNPVPEAFTASGPMGEQKK